MENIYKKVVDFVNTSQNTPGGKRLLQTSQWEQTYQIEISGKKPFYIDFKKGKVSVHKGECKEADFLDVTRVLFNDEDTLRKVFEGKKDSVEAQYRDKSITFFPSGKYPPIAFFHQLHRFGKEVIIAEVIQKFSES